MAAFILTKLETETETETDELKIAFLEILHLCHITGNHTDTLKWAFSTQCGSFRDFS